MLILLTNNLAPVDQKISVEDQTSTKNTVQSQGTPNQTLDELENSSFLSKMCKLIPTWMMTRNLPMIPLL